MQLGNREISSVENAKLWSLLNFLSKYFASEIGFTLKLKFSNHVKYFIYIFKEEPQL